MGYNSVTQFYLILTTTIISRDSPGHDFEPGKTGSKLQTLRGYLLSVSNPEKRDRNRHFQLSLPVCSLCMHAGAAKQYKMSMESQRFEISYPAYLKIPKTNLRIRKVTNTQIHTPSCMFMSLAANQQISLCMHTSTRRGGGGRGEGKEEKKIRPPGPPREGLLEEICD